MTVEDTIARQQAANKKLRNMAKADPKPRKKPIRFKQDDVNRIVRGVLDDLARSMPQRGEAIAWSAWTARKASSCPRNYLTDTGRTGPPPDPASMRVAARSSITEPGRVRPSLPMASHG